MILDAEVKRGGTVDHELENLAAARGSGERDRETLWKASVRHYHRDRSRVFTVGWQCFYSNLADEHQRLAHLNKERAEYLRSLLMRGGI